MTHPEPSADLAVRLLRESDWVRSLARSLVRSEADAEDLAQDTIVEALEARGDRMPRRLRAWLATITRRKAIDRHRRRSIQRAALDELKADAISGETSRGLDSDARFALHEELARVLRELPASERDLLLRRHVDQVPPRRLAKELNLTSEQVRKRLARALEKVRQKLSQSERGESGWNRALVLLAIPPRFPVPPLLALTAMSITKTLIAAAVFVLACGAAWRFLSGDTSSPPLAGIHADGDETHLLTEVPVDRPELDSLRIAAALEGPPAPATPVAAPAVAQVRIVNESGEAVRDARGVWLDSTSMVHPFEVNAEGGFPIPTNERVRVFARSELLCAVYAEISELAPDGVEDVVLPARPTLSLRVTVDGEAPGEPIGFTYLGGPPMEALDSGQSALQGKLKEHGFPPARLRVECSPAGEISVQLPEAVDLVWLRPQDGYVARALSLDGQETRGGSSEGFRVAVDEPGSHVDLAGLPALEGRFVWADTGKPYTGGIFFGRVDAEGASIGAWTTTSLWSSGTFKVPLFVTREILGDEWTRLAERPGGLQLSDIIDRRADRIHLRATSSPAAGYPHEFAVPGGLETIEVGDILVQRVPELSVRTLGLIDGDWVPIEAGVESSKGAVRTGQDGLGTIRFWPGDTLEVLATGFDLTRIRVPEEPGEELLEIRLEPAATLEVIVPGALLDPTGEHQPQVMIAYDTTPFGSWTDAAAPPMTMTHRMYRAYIGPMAPGLSKIQGKYLLIPVPPSGVVLVPGLRRGASIQVSLADFQNEVYATRSVVFDEPTRLDDWPAGLAPAYVDVTLVDSAGAAPPSGRYGLKATSSGTRYVAFEAGMIQAGPLVPGIHELTVLWLGDDGGTVTREFKNLDLVRGRNTLYLDLAVD